MVVSTSKPEITRLEFEYHGLWDPQMGSDFAFGCELSLGNPIDTSAVDVESNRSLPPTA